VVIAIASAIRKVADTTGDDYFTIRDTVPLKNYFALRFRVVLYDRHIFLSHTNCNRDRLYEEDALAATIQLFRGDPIGWDEDYE
jgi:hypothetical protein